MIFPALLWWLGFVALMAQFAFCILGVTAWIVGRPSANPTSFFALSYLLLPVVMILSVAVQFLLLR